jgi:hypothetical protein
LQAFELPRPVPLPELPGRTGTDRVENPLCFEAEAVELAVEPPVTRDGLGTRGVNFLHARHTARQEGTVGQPGSEAVAATVALSRERIKLWQMIEAQCG